jgi:hypothetical protein
VVADSLVPDPTEQQLYPDLCVAQRSMLVTLVTRISTAVDVALGMGRLESLLSVSRFVKDVSAQWSQSLTSNVSNSAAMSSTGSLVPTYNVMSDITLVSLPQRLEEDSTIIHTGQNQDDLEDSQSSFFRDLSDIGTQCFGDTGWYVDE